jgi:hypothetical protein
MWANKLIFILKMKINNGGGEQGRLVQSPSMKDVSGPTITLRKKQQQHIAKNYRDALIDG